MSKIEQKRIMCGNCRYMKVQDDGTIWCWLYGIAKSWEGFCDMWFGWEGKDDESE